MPVAVKDIDYFADAERFENVAEDSEQSVAVAVHDHAGKFAYVDVVKYLERIAERAVRFVFTRNVVKGNAVIKAFCAGEDKAHKSFDHVADEYTFEQFVEFAVDGFSYTVVEYLFDRGFTGGEKIQKLVGFHTYDSAYRLEDIVELKVAVSVEQELIDGRSAGSEIEYLLYGYIERSVDYLILKNVSGYEFVEKFSYRAADSHRSVNIHQIIHEVDIRVDNSLEQFSYNYIERSVDKVVRRDLVVELVAENEFKYSADGIAYGKVTVNAHKEV